MENKITEKLTIYDPAAALVDVEEIAFFIADALETADAAYIPKAPGVVARAQEMKLRAPKQIIYKAFKSYHIGV